MNMNELQIEQLFQFTRKHYVEWYDLQSELVDHLANGIEQQWQDNSKVRFEDALQIEFKKFGVFGFMDVVEERQKSLGKKYSKLIWKHVLDFFKIPKIFMLILFSATLFYLLRAIDVATDYFSITLGLMLISFAIAATVSSYRKKKREQRNEEKKWLFKDIIMGYGLSSGIGLIPFHFFNILLTRTSSFSNINAWLLGVMSFCFVLMCIMLYVMLLVIPKKVEEYLEETYPEYQLVKQHVNQDIL
ncbi:hypothetical protein [Nonlabens sp.]|jgi:cbb3-type cytochrome oxidase subunit 3|uniref:hypothetical protein n=1 Tax=Nonlabens sp. TaxID=1888209 RepID=UPI0039E5D4E5